MKSQTAFVERFFDIHEQELGRLLLMSGYLLLVIASYSTAKAVRDSLFVTKIGPSQLPYMYLLIAAAMGLVSLVYSRAVNRVGVQGLVRITSLIAISNLLLFWLLFRNNIISADQVIDADTLPKVRMPNRDGFVPDPRPDAD